MCSIFLTVGIFITVYAIDVLSFPVSKDVETYGGDISDDLIGYIDDGNNRVKGCILPNYSKAFNRATQNFGIKIKESIVRFIDIKDVKTFYKKWKIYNQGSLDYDYDEPLNGKYEKMAPELFKSCRKHNFEICSCNNIHEYVSHQISNTLDLLRFSSAFRKLRVYKGNVRLPEEENSNVTTKSSIARGDQLKSDDTDGKIYRQPSSGMTIKKILFRTNGNETTRLREPQTDKNETAENSTSYVQANMGLIFIHDNVKINNGSSLCLKNVTSINEFNVNNISESEDMKNETLLTSDYENGSYNATEVSATQDLINKILFKNSVSNSNITEEDVVFKQRSNDASTINLNGTHTERNFMNLQKL